MSQLPTRRSVVRRGALALAACATVLASTVAPSVRAGGFGIGADVPRADSDPRLANSVLVFHVGGCGAVGSSFEVRAEGIVDGKRVSVKLSPMEAHRSETYQEYGVRRGDWPAGGRWVLTATAARPPLPADPKAERPKPVSLVIRAAVPIGEDGKPVMRPTPGGKYDSVPMMVRPSAGATWEQTVAGLLAGKPAPIVAKAP